MSKELSFPECNKVGNLIRAECCNYYYGTCCYDRSCIQIDADHLVCVWFRDGVLPSDKKLQARINGEPSEDSDGVFSKGKLCCECGRPYLPNSNRGKYCPACAIRKRKEQKAESASRNKVKPER